LYQLPETEFDFRVFRVDNALCNQITKRFSAESSENAALHVIIEKQIPNLSKLVRFHEIMFEFDCKQPSR